MPTFKSGVIWEDAIDPRSEPDSGNPTVRDRRGASGNVTYTERCAPLISTRPLILVGVSPNLWVDSISIEDVYLFEELGSIEAAWHMQLNKLGPFIVDIDCKGNNLFDRLDTIIAKNKERVYRMLNIPDDFEYTKLY